MLANILVQHVSGKHNSFHIGRNANTDCIQYLNHKKTPSNEFLASFFCGAIEISLIHMLYQTNFYFNNKTFYLNYNMNFKNVFRLSYKL